MPGERVSATMPPSPLKMTHGRTRGGASCCGRTSPHFLSFWLLPPPRFARTLPGIGGMDSEGLAQRVARAGLSASWPAWPGRPSSVFGLFAVRPCAPPGAGRSAVMAAEEHCPEKLLISDYELTRCSTLFRWWVECSSRKGARKCNKRPSSLITHSVALLGAPSSIFTFVYCHFLWNPPRPPPRRCHSAWTAIRASTCSFARPL